MTLDEKEILINKVCCNILRRVCKSVNEHFPILPEENGRYDLRKVLDEAIKEYEDAIKNFPNVSESDRSEILSAVSRDLESFVKMLNE